jgi:hypothetical protein
MNHFTNGFSESFVNTGKTVVQIVTDPMGFVSDTVYAVTHRAETWNAITDYYDVTSPEGVGHLTGDVTQAIIIKKVGESIGELTKVGTTKAPGLWSETTSVKGLANKLHNIFDNPDKDFTPLLIKYGRNQTKAFESLEVSARNYVQRNGVTDFGKGITVKVKEIDVVVTGNVANGTVNIGSAWIK